MPKRNAIKHYGVEQFYHVYNRGVNKTTIFQEDADKLYFLGLLKQFLGSEGASDRFGRERPNYADEVDLVAYCLMNNHFHFLVYLKETNGLEKLMRSLMTSYSMYFNRKYARTGGLFEGRFLASRVTTDAYFWHVSRYIHLNPLDAAQRYETYPFSSLGYFRGEKHASWVHPEHLVENDEERQDYIEGLAETEEYHRLQHALKEVLANNPEK